MSSSKLDSVASANPHTNFILSLNLPQQKFPTKYLLRSILFLKLKRFKLEQIKLERNCMSYPHGSTNCSSFSFFLRFVSSSLLSSLLALLPNLLCLLTENFSVRGFVFVVNTQTRVSLKLFKLLVMLHHIKGSLDICSSSFLLLFIFVFIALSFLLREFERERLFHVCMSLSSSASLL